MPSNKLFLLGSFHFDNPGLDVAQFENANILSVERQKELSSVISSLIGFKPDKIFVESIPEHQPQLDSLYKLYRNKKWKPDANEIYQLGFRLAAELNLPAVLGVDYQDTEFPFDSLIKVLVAEKQIEILNTIQFTIDSIQKSFNQNLKTLTLKEILLQQNSPDSEKISVGSYLNLLMAGDKNNHVGSYLVSEWWRRNMVIYENILKRIDQDDQRILVIFGSAHTALLKEFIKYNSAFNVVDVREILQ